MKKKMKQLLRSNNAGALGTSPQAKTQNPSVPALSVGTKESIAKQEKELRDTKDLVGLYEEEDRLNRAKISDLERRVTNLTVQLELVNAKQARFLRIDQFLIELAAMEKDRDFAADLGVCGPTFSLSHMMQTIISGNPEEGWKAIEIFRERVAELSRKMTTLTNTPKKESIAFTKPSPTTTMASEELVRNRVEEVLEDRVRTLVRSLYEDALALPNRIRQIYNAFSADRAKFQDVIHVRRRLTDDLMHTHKLDANFSILRDSIQRYLPLSKPEDVAELESLIRLARSSLERLNELDEQATILAEHIEQHKTRYLETNTEASGLWEQAANIKALCALFALPYPAEVDRQVDHTKQQLSFVNPRSEESVRIGNMSMYQTTFPDRPKALKDLLAHALPLAEALLLKVRKVNPEDLFRDDISRSDALARLFMIASLVCNNTESNMFRGHKGRKTLVESVLASGLISQKDVPAFTLIPDQVKNFYELERFKLGWMWRPKTECIELAKQFLFQDCLYPDAVRASILDGGIIYKETSAAERKAQAGTEDDEL